MGRHVVSPTTTGNLPPTPQGGQVPKVLLQSLDRKVTTEDVQMPVLTRWDVFCEARSRVFREGEASDSAWSWEGKGAFSTRLFWHPSCQVACRAEALYAATASGWMCPS